MKRMYLYGLAGADQMYRVVYYSYIDEEYFSIRNILTNAYWLRIKNPSVEHVYVVDNRKGLLRDFMDARTNNSIESWAIFKDVLEREGMKVI